MAPSPDLFVVCKNCRAEVSPYITECPYCGHRLRKRAPKLDKGGVPKPPKKRRKPPTPSLGRLKPGEMPGVRTDGKPVATFALVLIPIVFTVLLKAAIVDFDAVTTLTIDDLGPGHLLGTTFFYISTGYELAALGAVFLFGWLLERRHGPWAPLLVYGVGAAAGLAAALALDSDAIVLGGNAGALALLCAWAVRDLAALRRSDETESDMLGVLVIVLILALLPAAVDDADWIAGATGALAGLLMGFPLARMRER